MNKQNNGKLPFAPKHIASNEYLLILFHYLMSMTFYQSIFYLHMDTPSLQYIKILVRNSLGHEMIGYHNINANELKLVKL